MSATTCTYDTAIHIEGEVSQMDTGAAQEVQLKKNAMLKRCVDAWLAMMRHKHRDSQLSGVHVVYTATNKLTQHQQTAERATFTSAVWMFCEWGSMLLS